jgi:hypothetical protein
MILIGCESAGKTTLAAEKSRHSQLRESRYETPASSGIAGKH